MVEGMKSDRASEGGAAGGGATSVAEWPVGGWDEERPRQCLVSADRKIVGIGTEPRCGEV